MLTPKNLTALIGSMLEIQATLSSVGLALFVYLASRWRERLVSMEEETVGEQINTKEEFRMLASSLAKISRIKWSAYASLIVLIIIPVIELQIYFWQIFENWYLAHILTSLFVVAALIIILSLREESKD